MAQSAVVDILGASHLNQVIATVPANSQIIDVVLNVTVNNDGGAATVSVGTAADGDAFINAQNVKALGTTRGTLDTEATDVGTTDIQVLADFTGANGDSTTGAATATVLYPKQQSKLKVNYGRCSHKPDYYRWRKKLCYEIYQC